MQTAIEQQLPRSFHRLHVSERKAGWIHSDRLVVCQNEPVGIFQHQAVLSAGRSDLRVAAA
jgi:hypothetical protein